LPRPDWAGQALPLPLTRLIATVKMACGFCSSIRPARIYSGGFILQHNSTIQRKRKNPLKRGSFFRQQLHEMSTIHLTGIHPEAPDKKQVVSDPE
jgi:hypothetical protein